MTTNEWTRFAPRAGRLPPGKKWTVFLSYRSVNRPWVLNLYDILRQHGHKVFLDQVSLVGGQPLVSALESNLLASRAGILIWSATAADSDWVMREYQTMESVAQSDKDFRFVPVCLDKTSLPAFARVRLFLDFSAYPDGPNGGELLRLLYAVVGRELSVDAVRFAVEQDERAGRATSEIQSAIEIGDADRLMQLFKEGSLPWKTTSVLGCRAAEGLTKLKRYGDAIVIVEELESLFPKAIRPKQLHALALARRGAAGDLEKAQRMLATLKAAGHKDPETLGIYARTWMDLYEISGNPLDLKKSRNLYAAAFEFAQDDYYTGINAASKSVLIGTTEDIAKGKALAKRVRRIVGTAKKEGDYWHTATVAEVQLLLGNYAAAGQRYDDAVAMAPKELGSHETAWKQACRLMRKLRPTPTERAKVRRAFAHLPDCDALSTDITT